MYSDLKTAIKAHVSEITGIKNVYGYEKGDLDGFPSAVVVCESLESNIDSTYSNDRKYTFKIKVYQEFEADSIGVEEAEAVIEGLIDTIIAKFENDYTLGGLAYKSDIKGILAYVDRGNMLRVIEITLDCFSSVTLT